MSWTTEELVAQITTLKDQLECDPDAFLRATIDLTDADMLVMGKFIQLYCYGDLNARRIIDALRLAAIGPNAMNASRLQDAQVFPKLREAADLLWDSNLKEGLHKAAETIELHRTHRHTFAHWAARRIPGHDALIVFSKNAREAERRDGIAPQPTEMKYGIVPMEGFKSELPKLEGHTLYLAESASHVETHIEEFRERSCPVGWCSFGGAAVAISG